MSAYLVGNLLGRLFFSYVFVWLLMFIVASRFEWRQAFRRTHKWYGLLTVVALFAVGIAGALRQGGVA